MQEVNEEKIYFIGQQDGGVEREFLAKVSSVFEETSASLSSAYLCRVHYGDPSIINVAICIISPQKNNIIIVENIANIFRCQFNSEEHIDIIFLTNEQEVEIRAVCNPFYLGSN